MSGGGSRFNFLTNLLKVRSQVVHFLWAGLGCVAFLCGGVMFADNGASIFAVPATGITVDGDLSDWPQLIDRQVVSSAQHFDYPTDSHDGYAYFQVAYNLVEGAIYVGFEVHDQSRVPMDRSNPEHQDRLGLFLDLRPLLVGDSGGESLNYYFHLRRDFSGWMSQVGRGWTPVEGIATIAQRDRGETWMFEMRIEVESLSNGKARLQAGGFAGIDVGFYDVDEDASVSDILWGPGVGKYESLSYGDVFFMDPGDRLVPFKGKIQSDASTSGFLRDVIHVQSSKFPNWPSVLVVGDENGEFEKRFPAGPYEIAGATIDSLELRDSGGVASVQVLERAIDQRSVVPWLESAPLKVRAPDWAQDGEWLTANLRELFPGIVVGALAVDKDEILWVGTNLGLFTYDGFEYIHYPVSGDGAGFSFDRMVFDASGLLWIVDRSRGLFVFEEGKLFEFRSFGRLLLRLNDLFVSKDGDVWIAGMMGVLRYSDDRFQMASSVGNYRLAAAQSIVVSSQGSLWIAGPSNRLHRYFGGALDMIDGWKQDRSILRGSYGSLAADGANQVYLNAADGVVLCFRDAPDSAEITRTEQARLGGSITELVVRSDGDLWAAGETVNRIAQGRVIHSAREAGLLSLSIDSVVCSPSGRVWACSSFDGLARFRNPNVTEIAMDGPTSFFTAGRMVENGELFLGTNSSGILRVRGGETVQIHRSSNTPELPSDHITCLERDSLGGVWIGTTGGVCYYSADGEWQDWRTSLVRPVGWVTSIAVSKELGTWVGTLTGAYRLDGDTWSEESIVTEWRGPSSVPVLGMMWDRDRRLWVSTASGLSMIEGGELRGMANLSKLIADSPMQMVDDVESNRYWFGTTRRGLFRFDDDPEKRRFQQISVDAGLTDVAITSILVDSSQRIWVGTNNGLNRIDDNSVSSFGRGDGLPSNRVTKLAELQDGRILIVTRTGVVVYAPGKGHPEVRAELLRQGGRREIELDSREIFSDQEIVIEARGYSESSSAQQLNYCYRFANSGSDSEWVHSRDSLITLGRLPVGDYQIEVLAIDRDLNASVEPVEVHFSVVHPAWVWFQRIALVLFGGITIPAICLAWIRGRQRNQSRAELVRRTLENNQSLIRAKKEAEDARFLAERANSAKSEFLASISHEIRTPMNAIVGFSRFLGDANLPDAKRIQMAGSIDRSSRHLLGLVNDLLDFSKIEAGKAELELEPFDLDVFVSDVSEFFEPRCRKKQLGWSFKSELGERMRVRGDVTRIRQILYNLIGNAIKFTDVGEVSLSVVTLKGKESSTETRGTSPVFQMVQFAVKDSGRGIDQDDKERIFGSFSQGQLGREKGGTGLGLAIASRLTELMKGALRVESVRGRGSEFFLEVPLEIVPANLAPVQTLPVVISKDDIKSVSERAELLVVDDNPDNRLLLRMLLKSLSVSVFEANNGATAMSVLDDRTPDVILMDLRMPGMTGYEVFDRIREVDRLKSVPVVAVTASAFSHEQKACLDHGFDAFISKPIDADELLRVVRQFLGDIKRETEDPLSEISEPPSLGCELDAATRERLEVLIQQYRRTELNEMLTQLRERDEKSKAFVEQCQAMVLAGDWPGLLAALKHCWSTDSSRSFSKN